MTLKFSEDQRQQYLLMTDRIGGGWIHLFGDNTEFYSAAYWDLLTGIWRVRGPVRKTDALKMMKAIKSAHTAGKYIDTALQSGILVEEDNPQDARSKLLRLSPDMRQKMDVFFDEAVEGVLSTARKIDENA